VLVLSGSPARLLADIPVDLPASRDQMPTASPRPSSNSVGRGRAAAAQARDPGVDLRGPTVALGR